MTDSRKLSPNSRRRRREELVRALSSDDIMIDALLQATERVSETTMFIELLSSQSLILIGQDDQDSLEDDDALQLELQSEAEKSDDTDENLQQLSSNTEQGLCNTISFSSIEEYNDLESNPVVAVLSGVNTTAEILEKLEEMPQNEVIREMQEKEKENKIKKLHKLNKLNRQLIHGPSKVEYSHKF